MGTHKQLTDFKQGEIKAKRDAGKKGSKIAQELNLNPRTVNKIIQTAEARLQDNENMGDDAWLPGDRPGQTRKLDNRERRQILGEIKTNTQRSFTTIANNYNKTHASIISPTYPRCIAKEESLGHYKMIPKPFLKQEHKDKLIKWAHEIGQVDVRDIVFTDEASVYVGQRGEV
jgi:hypothetical protein